MPSLKGQLLIADPALLDPNFARTVLLLVEHGQEGALGLVLNRPTPVKLAEAWAQVSDTPCTRQDPLHLGGPCPGPLMALHNHADLADDQVLPGVFFSAQQDSLEQLLERQGGLVRFFFNYAGWAAKQLESELRTESWLLYAGSSPLVFAADPRGWQALLRRVHFRNVYPDARRDLLPDDPRVN